MSRDPLTEVYFWAQVMTDAQRTVLCPPEWESRCKGYVDARGLAGLIKVVASTVIPDGQIIVVDEQAMEASWRQSLQTFRPRFEPLYPTGFADVAQALRRDIIFGAGWWRRATPPAQLDYPLDRWEDDGGCS